MVVLDNTTRLSVFGCESLVRTAAFHTQILKGIDDQENQSENEVEIQRFINRLSSISRSYAYAISQIFSKNGAKLEFADNHVEISCLKFSTKFTECADLVFFLRMIRPYIRLIVFSGTFFWREHLIAIAEALIGVKNGIEVDGGYSCLNAETLLKFDKLGNDNAISTLIEYLTQNNAIKRIELDEEFAVLLKDDTNEYDFIKVKSSTRHDFFYAIAYLGIHSREYDLVNVCSMLMLITFNMEMFEISQKPFIEKISMSYCNEPIEVLQEGVEYLKNLTPNLKELGLVEGRGVVFAHPENSFQAAREIYSFENEVYKQRIAPVFQHLRLHVKLELSIYVKDDAEKEKIDWFAEIKKGYPNLNKVYTEFNTPALQLELPSSKPGDSVEVRVHVYEKNYNQSESNNWPHPAPLNVY